MAAAISGAGCGGSVRPTTIWAATRPVHQGATAALDSFLSSAALTGRKPKVRELAERAGISKSTAHRLLQGISEPLGRRARFKLSDDPLFTARVREVVGLYLNAPGYAFALCVGDSLNAPASIVGTALTARGSVRGVGGETGDAPMALPVALDLSLASPADRFKASARHRDFLYFLEKLDTAVPAAFDVYVIEAYESYKHRKVRDWLTERPRFHMSNIYDSSVWLKQLECWLRVI